MQSSASSSATSPLLTPDERPRSSFVLAGRSVHLDPRTHAVRGDLADIRLADRVFAPHYAAPMPRPVRVATVLRGTPGVDGEPLADLAAGSSFEVLDLLDAVAWGVAPSVGLVGYVACDHLALHG